MPAKYALACALALAAGLAPTGRASGQIGSPSGNDFPGAHPIWVELSAGGAASRLSCEICEADRETGPTVDLALGAYATPRVRVGVQSGFWTHEDEGFRETTYRAGVVAHLYAKRGSGLFVLGGLGWSGYRAGDFRTETARLTLGAGWDLSLAPGWQVGNTLALDATAFGSLKRQDTTLARGVGLSVLRLGVFLRRI
jgi:hypothetical protein